MAHTPGPWKARYTPNRAPSVETWCIDWSEDQEEVAEIVHGEENARLIAAAPDLLEALKLAKAEIWRLLDVKGVEPIAARKWPEILAAEAAIAKATGGQ